MHKKKTVIIEDMHLSSQYSSINVKVGTLLPLACVDMTEGHEGRSTQVATVVLFSHHKVVAAVFA